MAAKERIIFQPYTTGRGNNVLPGQAVFCRNPEDAQRRAEKAMAGGRIVGAHILRVLDDEAAMPSVTMYSVGNAEWIAMSPV